MHRVLILYIVPVLSIVCGTILFLHDHPISGSVVLALAILSYPDVKINIPATRHEKSKKDKDPKQPS